jgi:hypothetical protein
MIATTTEKSLVSTVLQQERRTNPRLSIAKPLLACTFGPEYKEEVQTTSNTSGNGLYFETPSPHYYVGMLISVLVGYAPGTRYHSPSFGRVARIDRLPEGNFGVAVRILMR